MTLQCSTERKRGIVTRHHCPTDLSQQKGIADLLDTNREARKQFQEASFHSNYAPATHVYGVPGETVGVDIMGPPPLTKKENRYILVMIDYFTKVTEAEPLKSQNTETLASTFFNRRIC
ncbi:unnamed protein product [Taenia asiatica]|uniref:Integrase catalytic domain-containing protein n=1 Tax=Taenia asiatica TaxID=60517 RepID=A0A0R3VY44_TAEAS|nr:unnamed protein product [Taenia asiatica]